MLVGQIQRSRELPRIHARRTEIADLARPHDVVKCIEGLLERGVRIESVNLIEVDVVGAQSTQ